MATYPLLDPYNSQPIARPHRGAQHSRRLHGIYRTIRSATSVNTSDGRHLQQVIDDFVRNLPWVESYLSAWVSHTVGTGINPYFAASDETERTSLRNWWRRWITETDADGMTSLHGQTALVSRMVAKDGEVFARLRPRRLSDGLSTPLQIQLISAAQVPRDKMDGGRPGNTVIGGIERDAIGRRVAYHIYTRHPGDPSPTGRFLDIPLATRVPANQILHIGLPQDVGELRHVSILRSSILTLKGMSDTNDNTIERLRVASLFTALWSSPLNEYDEPQEFGAGDPNAQGVADTRSFEPGVINELPPGASVFFPEAPDVGSTYVEFMQGQLESIAASLGIPFSELSGNYGKTNFSSLRAAIIHARRRHNQFNQLCLIDQWLAPIVKAGIEAAILAGTLDLPGFFVDPSEYVRILWRGQRHEYLDPQTDATADEMRLSNKQVTLSSLVDGDFEEHVRQLADDQAILERYGISTEPVQTAAAARPGSPDEVPAEDDEPED